MWHSTQTKNVKHIHFWVGSHTAKVDGGGGTGRCIGGRTKVSSFVSGIQVNVPSRPCVLGIRI